MTDQSTRADDGCRVLLVGEDNPQSSDPEHALYPMPTGCAGNRLQSKILGIPSSDYLNLWRTNLCNPTWSMPAARRRALDILSDSLAEWSVVVILGAKVARAMCYPDAAFTCLSARVETQSRNIDGRRKSTIEYPTPAYTYNGFEACEGEKLVVYLPHPSGRNHVWNEPRHVLAAQVLMRACVPEIAWGTL